MRATTIIGLTVAAGLYSCAATLPSPERRNLAEAILSVEQARLAAFRGNDKAAFSRLVADDLTMVHSNGEIFGKAQEMSVMRSSTPDRPLPTLGLEDTQVRGYGDSAVLTGSLVERNGATVLLRLRFTNVYARKAGRWQLVAGQLTKASTA